MKIKIASSIEELRMAVERECEAQMQVVMQDTVTKILNVLRSDTDALLDAVEQQIAAWEAGV